MKLLEYIVVLGMALLMSQFSFFVEQYDIRLQAHIAEAELVVSRIQAIADERHKSVEEYIRKFYASSDPDILAQGLFMRELIDRYQRLLLFHQRIVAQPALLRPVVFPFCCERSIAIETLYGFHAGVVLTVAGVVWTAFGALFGYLLVVICRWKKKKSRKGIT